jgi:hypothetical protein
MKLSLEQHGETYTIQTQTDDQTPSDMLQYVYQLMLCAGYSKHIVDEAIFYMADDRRTYDVSMVNDAIDKCNELGIEIKEDHTLINGNKYATDGDFG